MSARTCPKCKAPLAEGEGGHFVPPSLGEPGFFLCEVKEGPAGAVAAKAIELAEAETLGHELRAALAEIERLEKAAREDEAENARLNETLNATRRNHDRAWRNFRAVRGRMEFYAGHLREQGVDPWALWLEHLCEDAGARRRWAVEEKGSVRIENSEGVARRSETV